MLRTTIIFLGTMLSVAGAAELAPVVEIEEDVYSYADAGNGAGPMWASGNTCLVRAGDQVFASGLETIPGAEPLNNCRWVLYDRAADGWRRVHEDDGRTREPAPLVAYQDGRIYLSANPALKEAPPRGGGPARPEVFQFAASDPGKQPERHLPVWQGSPSFTEHSYRSFAADGALGELVLFQNIGYTHAEWAFWDSSGSWSAQGQLKWPWGAEYDEPEPVRVCYPRVALRNRAVHFLGVSDIVEPYREWREFKRKLTGREWDYDFRRLFYTWTGDITKQPFAEWVEIASRDKTAGWITPGDLWIGPGGEVHLLWSERAIDERLRERFFPLAKQSESLQYAIVREGQVVLRKTLLESTEEKLGLVGSAGRFLAAPGGRLFVACYVSGVKEGGGRVSENRVMEIGRDGVVTGMAALPLKRPFTNFYTATQRGGSPPSNTLEMLGQRAGVPNTISYARVRLVGP